MCPAVALALMSGWVTLAWAQQPGIYTCIDAQGRRITSDRPIAECNDRDQQQLNPTGTIRRTIKPQPTAQERAEQEEQERKATAERARVDEERRRDRALLIRYPTPARHDAERDEALRQTDEVIATARKRIQSLDEQRQKIETELDFYRKNPAKAPTSLKRQIDENLRSVQAQNNFIADKLAEKDRVRQRFGAERVRLEGLWAQQAAPPAQRPPASR